jgi:membrane carboxypeptidase/penicillin-binding protein
MLRFDGNDKALAAYGDQIFLGTSAFGQLAQSAAQALFNRSLLALDLAADTPQIS